MDIFVNPMKVTLKQFFKSTFGKPTTVMYPLEKRDPPPTYRGMNAVIWDLCIGCGICGEVCPNKCLKMKPVDLSEEEQDKAWYGSHVAKKKNKAEIKSKIQFKITRIMKIKGKCKKEKNQKK